MLDGRLCLDFVVCFIVVCVCCYLLLFVLSGLGGVFIVLFVRRFSLLRLR